MGEIADMHIEAYEAGLDPNEMDGADWAEFYDDDDCGPKTPSDFINEVGCGARMLLSDIDDLQDEDDFDSSTENRASVLNLYIPAFGEEDARTLVQLLSRLSDEANAEMERLTEDTA